MEPLHGRVRPYAWGSRSVIATLQGRPVPTSEPEAELWLGAHGGDPSDVHRPEGLVSLLDVIAADPVAALGAPVVDQFGARLPYLLKVLAADAPLSMQAHPDAERAKARYAEGNPNYTDPYHKPELLVAIDEFEALCGFRAPEESARVLRTLDLPELTPIAAMLDGSAGTGAEEAATGTEGGAAGARLRAAVTALLEWPAAERSTLVSDVAKAARRCEHPDCLMAAELADRYPGDLGALVALLLNRIVLKPGEAVWMPAGNLHAYLSGAGVEIMAASDNVLRGGLTPKRVDVPELLAVLRFEVLAQPIVRPVPVAPGVVTWPVPVPDFALYRVAPAGAPVELAVPGPRIVLCLTGQLSVDDGTGPLVLGPGDSGFAAASGGPLVISGDGEAYVAATGGR